MVKICYTSSGHVDVAQDWLVNVRVRYIASDPGLAFYIIVTSKLMIAAKIVTTPGGPCRSLLIMSSSASSDIILCAYTYQVIWAFFSSNIVSATHTGAIFLESRILIGSSHTM